MLISSGLLRSCSIPRSCTKKVTRQRRKESYQRAAAALSSRMVASTQAWLDRVVIAEKLCPFAPPLTAANTLRIVESTAVNEKQAVAHVKKEVELLLLSSAKDDSEGTVKDNTAIGLTSTTPHHETTLVVFDAPFVQDFRDFVRLSWTLQEEIIVGENHLAELQLVLFHPTATHQTYSSHAGDGNGTAADYTIRSPYPVVHLLRKVDVMRAEMGGYPNLEELPARNKRKLLAQGLSVCQARLEECFVVVDKDDDKQKLI